MICSVDLTFRMAGRFSCNLYADQSLGHHEPFPKPILTKMRLIKQSLTKEYHQHRDLL